MNDKDIVMLVDYYKTDKIMFPVSLKDARLLQKAARDLYQPCRYGSLGINLIPIRFCLTSDAVRVAYKCLR